MPKKSLRTAFIRVSATNNTDNGLVEYDRSYIQKIIENFSKKYMGTEYFYIEHSADEEVSMTHWHIVFRFKNPIPFDNIKMYFPYGNIESCRSVKQCVQYLVHQNDESKKQYEWAQVVSNCKDLTPYKVKNDKQSEVDIQKILERIDKGEIKEYNQFEAIPIEIWSKYRSRIENALLYYRERVCMDKNREIQVVFISGDTGTGKTTFAKQFCEKTNLTYCVSSSSNDAMQDYKGEDVLILDDLRDDSFAFADLLKILDNHTKSSVKSRYHNKAFIGNMIIITSYRPITDWYFDVKQESRIQLFRRVKTWYKFYDDKVDVFEYNEDKFKYIKLASMPNPVRIDKQKQVNMGLKMMEAFGFELEPDTKKRIVENFENAVQEEIPKEWY